MNWLNLDVFVLSEFISIDYGLRSFEDLSYNHAFLSVITIYFSSMTANFGTWCHGGRGDGATGRSFSHRRRPF
jgi:hypothetical protein